MMRVKICGVTRAEDALLAAELGASAVGFIFWPGSPRFIDPYRARAISIALPAWVVPVGVFVNQPVEYVCGVAALARLGAIQLHGDEPPDVYSRLTHRVIRSVAVTDDFDPDAVRSVTPRATVLLDAHDPVKRGGTGRTVDWMRAAAAARIRPVFLSGGLTPDNVRAAVDAVKPHAVDVSSGIESRPGIKDSARMRALFASLS